MLYVLIAICGIVAGAISGVVGTGSSIILLPVLSLAFGPKAAIPIMAIASIAGNASRVLAWRRQINLRAFVWYSVAAVYFKSCIAHFSILVVCNLCQLQLAVYAWHTARISRSILGGWY